MGSLYTRRGTIITEQGFVTGVLSVFLLLSFGAATEGLLPGGGGGGDWVGDDETAINCTAVFPGVNVGCCHALASNASSDLPASSRPLARMAYASGTSLPYDAGHYTTCTHTSDAAYFLLSWHVNHKDIPVTELGLCLPRTCHKADVEALMGYAGRGGGGGGGDISAAALANRTKAAVTKAEGILRGFGASSCAKASRPGGGGSGAAAAHCREYRVVMAALDAASALADEAAEGDGGDGWIGAGGTVNLVVTSPSEDRVGFVKGASSGWAAFFLAATAALLSAVLAATALDLAGLSGGSGGGVGGGDAPRGDEGELSEPLLEEHVEGEAPSLPPAPGAASSSGTMGLNRRASTTKTSLGVVADRLNVMSLRRNLTKLLASPLQPGPTDCLNGMRVVSMVWIILGHTMMMPTPINGFDNPEDLVARWGARGSTWFQLVIGGEIAVDSFFYLSGFLIAYLGVKDLEKRGGKIPVFGMIAHRYARITPAFAATLVFYSEIASRVGHGPFFIRFQRSVFRRCDSMWWSELLYLHNFIPFDSDKVCMGWSWYLGNDFIFFLFSPAVLLLHHHHPRAMWLSMAGVVAVSLTLTFWLVVHYGGGLYIFGDTYVKYSMYAYSKPYCRVPAYLVGMAFGFLNERWVSDESRRPALSPTATATFLSAAGVALLACVFVPLSDYRDAESWPPWANGLFLAFSRPLWATALGVITTACALGRLPRLNAFLSSPLWTPLARLTFGAYLMHPVVIKWLAGTATASYHFSMHYIASCALFNAACAFSLAAVMWLVVERPVMNIESALRAGKRL